MRNKPEVARVAPSPAPPGVVPVASAAAGPSIPVRAAGALWWLAAAAAVWSFGYTLVRGSDLWWHLAAGRWMVENRSFPRRDPWSYTREGQPWLHHEWLSDLVYHAWAGLFGIQAIAYWKWLILIATFLVLLRVLWRSTGQAAASYLAVLGAAALASPFLDIRPHLYSMLGFTTLLLLTLDRARPSLLCLPLFLVWANLHSGFVFGLLALGCLLLPALVFSWRGDEPRRRRALLLAFACPLITLVNPNGLEAILYPFKYAFDRTSPFLTLREWQPPFAPGGMRSALYPYAIGAFALAMLLVLASRTIRLRAGDWIPRALLGLLTLAMSLRSRRFIPFFAMAAALLVAPVLARLLAPLVDRLPLLLAPAVALAAGLLLLRPYPLTPYAFHYLTAEDSFPIETLNFIEVNQFHGRVFAYYNWGGYVHLRTAGQMKVFIDGRADTVYDADTYYRYIAALRADPGAEQVVAGADFVLWPSRGGGRLAEDLIASGSWFLLYQDSVSVLLVGNDVPLPASLRDTPDSAYRELKLAGEERRDGRLAAAEEHFRRALAKLPYLRAACYGIADAQAGQERLEDAQMTIGRCQRLYPSSAWRKSYGSTAPQRGPADQLDPR